MKENNYTTKTKFATNYSVDVYFIFIILPTIAEILLKL